MCNHKTRRLLKSNSNVRRYLPLKKQNYTDEEIPIFDEAFIYKRGAYWHFRMWLNNERKYARKKSPHQILVELTKL